MYKRFDRALFEENDKKCRTKVKELLQNEGFAGVDNVKVRGVDILLYKDGNHIGYIEVERKAVWKGDKFQYDNVQFPERKAKYAKLDKPTIFVMFNEDMSKFLAVRDKDLLSSPCVEVPNKYVYKGEQFFQVPLTKVKFDDITELLKEIVNGQQ